MNKILIGIISNREFIPSYFVRNLFELVEHTRKIGKVAVQEFRAVEVQQMRNNCCIYALDNNFDYIFMLDTDMTYPAFSIAKLIKHNKDFVVGSATQRTFPFYPTQYKEIACKDFKSKENRVFISKKNKDLIEIGATGVVGALIKVSSLNDLKKPFFQVEYKENGEDVIGSDIYFCRKWKESGKKIYLDPTVNYNHQVTVFSNSFGNIIYR